jgi:hypothetical protein
MGQITRNLSGMMRYSSWWTLAPVFNRTSCRDFRVLVGPALHANGLPRMPLREEHKRRYRRRMAQALSVPHPWEELGFVADCSPELRRVSPEMPQKTPPKMPNRLPRSGVF